MDTKASAGGRTQHPLPKTQRPHVSVDEETLRRWKQDALDDIESVLLDQKSWFYGFDAYLQRHEYKLLLDKPSVRGGGRVRPQDSQTVDFLCRVQLDLTLEDVVLALYNASNLEQRLAFAQIYQDIVLDAALIKLYEQDTEGEDPFHCVSIKWIAFDSPARQILRHRDCLYYEFCCTTQDSLGRRVLVEYKRSVDLDPDQLRDHGLDILRRPIFTLTMYRMEGDKVVSKVRGVNEPNGQLRSRVSMNYLPIVFTRYLNLQGLPHSKALLRIGVRASALATRQSNVEFYCHSCRRRFGITTRKAWCRACGRTICRHCTFKLILPVDGDQIAPRLPLLRTRFCRGCIVFAHSQTKAVYGPNSMRSTSDSDGFSCVDSDSFFGTLGDMTTRSARVDSTDTPMLSSSRLERLLARLSLGSDLHQEPKNASSTDASSDSSRTSIYADDGMRVFFPDNTEARESTSALALANEAC